MASCITLGVSAKSLKIAYDSDPVSLDPHEQLSGGTLQMSHMIFDPLLRWTQEFNFEPRLAKSWERTNDTTIRFKLRDNITFHSGNPLTAKDVKWTFDRVKNSTDFKAIFAPIAELIVVDDYTFDVVSKSKNPLILNIMTFMFPMDSVFYTGKDEGGNDKSIIKKHGDTYASRNASGTGPFIVIERDQGVKTEFKRFKNYWDTNSPGNVEDIILTPIKENVTRVSALLSGGVDFIAPVPPNDHKRIERSQNTKLVSLSGVRILTLQLNQERVAAFKDKRVRQAIAYAINNEGIVQKIMKGDATAAAQLSPKGYIGHNSDLKPRFDLKKAKQLMKEAGYEDGFTVTMLAPNNRYINDAKIAQAAASMLKKINITVDLKTIPKAQFWPAFDAREADIMMIGWLSDTNDSANFAEYLVACQDQKTGWGQYNSGNYCNKEIDELLRVAGTEINEEKRRIILQEVETKLYDDAAFIPLHWDNLTWGIKKGIDAEKVVNVMEMPYLGDLVIN